MRSGEHDFCWAAQRAAVNVEHVTSVRSDTQIPGARAQLDLTSGKFQGVQENVEQIMQLISATSGAHENGEIPSVAF